MRITVFDIGNWKEIVATLSRNKTRTFLTGFGIFWGVAMLALLMSGATGGEELLKRNFAGFATNSGGMVPELTGMPYHGYQKGRQWTMNMADISVIKREFPELSAVIPTFQKNNCSFRHGRYSYSGAVIGAGPDYEDMQNPRFYAGRFINSADEQGERRVAVVGRKIALRLFPDMEDPTGQLMDINGSVYSVIGVVGDVSEVHINGSLDESVIVPASTFRRVNGYGENVDFLMLVAGPDTDLAEVMPRIRRLLYRRHDIHPSDESALWSINIAEQFEQVDKLFSGIDMLAFFIGISTLIAGVIGIGNIMWVIVKERTTEIGIRRAIGARPSDIIAQILCEGALLTLVSGMAGLTLAAAILGVMQAVNNPPDAASTVHFQMSLGRAVSILVIFMSLGVAAGIVPAIKAMKIKPVEAINAK